MGLFFRLPFYPCFTKLNLNQRTKIVHCLHPPLQSTEHLRPKASRVQNRCHLCSKSSSLYLKIGLSSPKIEFIFCRKSSSLQLKIGHLLQKSSLSSAKIELFIAKNRFIFLINQVYFLHKLGLSSPEIELIDFRLS